MSNSLTIRQRIALEAFSTAEHQLINAAVDECSLGGVELQSEIWQAAHEIIVPDIDKHDIPLCDVVYRLGGTLGEMFAAALILDDSVPHMSALMRMSRDAAEELIAEWRA